MLDPSNSSDFAPACVQSMHLFQQLLQHLHSEQHTANSSLLRLLLPTLEHHVIPALSLMDQLARLPLPAPDHLDRSFVESLVHTISHLQSDG